MSPRSSAFSLARWRRYSRDRRYEFKNNNNNTGSLDNSSTWRGTHAWIPLG